MLRFRFPRGATLEARAEAFVGPALFEAMVRNVPLVIDDPAPLSRALHTRLNDIQRVFATWNGELAVVPIEARRLDEPPGTDEVLACFSGGIDSTYTYCVHRDQVTQLLLIEGFAAGRGGERDWEGNVAARTRFARAEGRQLIAVGSNIRGWLAKRELSLLLTHGAIVCSIAATLRPSRFLVPASYTADELAPWGSHPLVDPLWSTPATQVIHHGFTEARVEKTRVLCADQRLLDQLQVCWFAGSLNCGECGKCMRTALTLHLLGARSANLKPYTHRSQLALLKPTDLAHVHLLIEIARLAIGATIEPEPMITIRPPLPGPCFIAATAARARCANSDRCRSTKLRSWFARTNSEGPCGCCCARSNNSYRSASRSAIITQRVCGVCAARRCRICKLCTHL